MPQDGIDRSLHGINSSLQTQRAMDTLSKKSARLHRVDATGVSFLKDKSTVRSHANIFGLIADRSGSVPHLPSHVAASARAGAQDKV
jgi:hypothetical protein